MRINKVCSGTCVTQIPYCRMVNDGDMFAFLLMGVAVNENRQA